MARVIAFVPDLLFGSNVLGALTAAGHDATLAHDLQALDTRDADVLIVDLTSDAQERIALVKNVAGTDVKTLAFYSHVETDTKERAEQANIDLVVPRSRMAREAGALVARLSASG